MQLNPQQQEAVCHLSSPLMVIAGAGSGKTGVITQKIVYLLQQAGYAPENVYALTFTNRAAKEMKERVSYALGAKGRGVKISTFHRLGLNFLRKEYARVGLRAGFSIFDTHDINALLRDLLHTSDDLTLRAVHSRLSFLKNCTKRERDILLGNTVEDDAMRLACLHYHAYQERLRAYNALDFDDLLLLPVEILENHEDARNDWQRKVRYLLVDEYQDTNEAQYRLMRLLTGKGEAFTVVGDDDQSIYAWRGAKVRNIAQLQSDYPRLKTVKLEQNYRCQQKILDAANQLIANNPHLVVKKLWSNLHYGDGVRVIKSRDEDVEANNIAGDISAAKIRFQLPYREIAILYRSNFQSRMVEQTLRELNIPYQVSGGTSFFEHSEVRDLLAYLRLLNNPDDDTAFLRIANVPKREIGASTLTKLGEYATKRGCSLLAAAGEYGFSQEIGEKAYQHVALFVDWIRQLSAQTCLPSELLERIIHDIEYKEYLETIYPETAKLNRRLERLAQLKSWLMKLEEDDENTSLAKLMQRLMLSDILEHQNQENQRDAVQLLTLHAAKGLEFRHVYLIGVEEGLLPHQNSQSDEGIQEERRLMYVGMTRAKENLTISYVGKRRQGGEWREVERSRFLDELPQEGISWEDGSKPLSKEERKAQNDAFFANMFAILHDSQS